MRDTCVRAEGLEREQGKNLMRQKAPVSNVYLVREEDEKGDRINEL